MCALLDLYITSYEVKNLKRNWNILNVKDIDCVEKEGVW
jgi:hypothetical protein